ncbi:hypothetical protein [Streptomyces sp. NPDC097610]|uniref:hypothetical protein n=1 Tax=Streptomyces sp. NPDC097610 TaxID=3157227 RepID=UPI00332A51BD
MSPGATDVTEIRRTRTTVDATPYFVEYGDNTWAAADDVFTESNAYMLMGSIRLDGGFGMTVHD